MRIKRIKRVSVGLAVAGAALLAVLAVGSAFSEAGAACATGVTRNAQGQATLVSYCVTTNPDANDDYSVGSLTAALAHHFNNHTGSPPLDKARGIVHIETGTYTDENPNWASDVDIRCEGNVTLRGRSDRTTLFSVGALAASNTFDGNGYSVVFERHATNTNQRAMTATTVVSATVRDVIFDGFTVTGDGGAVLGVATFIGCTFLNCTATGDGGAISGAVTIKGCTFDQCEADGNGGALHDITGTVGGSSGGDVVKIFSCTASAGGGIADSTADLVNVVLQENEATGLGGGGAYLVSGLIDRCKFWRNEATGTASGNGKGSALRQCHGRIENCLIYDNFAKSRAAVHNCDGGFKQNTVVGNRCDDKGAGLNGVNANIRNCAIFGNTAPNSGNNADQIRNSSNPKYCALPANWSGGGSNNVKTNSPGFANYSPTTDSSLWNFQLNSGSPLIDKGKSLTDITHDYLGVVARPQPANGKWDIGAYERP